MMAYGWTLITAKIAQTDARNAYRQLTAALASAITTLVTLNACSTALL